MMSDIRNFIEQEMENKHSHCGMHLPTPETGITFAENDTYEALAGTFENGCAKDFTLADGVLTYTGSITKTFHFTGTAGGKVSKQCDMTFGLFVNDVIVAGCETPVYFTAQDRSKAFTCAQNFILEPDDVITVKAKISDKTATFDLHNFSITLWGC